MDPMKCSGKVVMLNLSDDDTRDKESIWKSISEEMHKDKAFNSKFKKERISYQSTNLFGCCNFMDQVELESYPIPILDKNMLSSFDTMKLFVKVKSKKTKKGEEKVEYQLMGPCSQYMKKGNKKFFDKAMEEDTVFPNMNYCFQDEEDEKKKIGVTLNDVYRKSIDYNKLGVPIEFFVNWEKIVGNVPDENILKSKSGGESFYMFDQVLFAKEIEVEALDSIGRPVEFTKKDVPLAFTYVKFTLEDSRDSLGTILPDSNKYWYKALGMYDSFKDFGFHKEKDKAKKDEHDNFFEIHQGMDLEDGRERSQSGGCGCTIM